MIVEEFETCELGQLTGNCQFPHTRQAIKEDEFHNFECTTRSLRSPFCLSGLRSWTKALSILERDKKRLHHFGVDKVATKLVQFPYPEIKAGKVTIW